jgi:hypothetical protein
MIDAADRSDNAFVGNVYRGTNLRQDVLRKHQ